MVYKVHYSEVYGRDYYIDAKTKKDAVVKLSLAIATGLLNAPDELEEGGVDGVTEYPDCPRPWVSFI